MIQAIPAYILKVLRQKQIMLFVRFGKECVYRHLALTRFIDFYATI